MLYLIQILFKVRYTNQETLLHLWKDAAESLSSQKPLINSQPGFVNGAPLPADYTLLNSSNAPWRASFKPFHPDYQFKLWLFPINCAPSVSL
jgi:hypothetical protein